MQLAKIISKIAQQTASINPTLAARLTLYASGLHPANINQEQIDQRLSALEKGPRAADILTKRVLNLMDTVNRQKEQILTLEERASVPRVDRQLGILDKEAIVQEIEQACQSRKPFALALVDIDDFRKVNATLGHKGGDLILELVANVLATNFGTEEDFVGRYGGEEFLILVRRRIDNFSQRLDISRQEIETLTHGLIPGLKKCEPVLTYRQTNHVDEPPQAVTVSIGCGTFRTAPESASSAIVKVDKASFLAKKLGKNRIENRN
ncbi:hypothetical protein B5M47_03420 [candidate division CPR3 bacterium 4484_211]|uniref:GGDEF domain-containing protein n=1 Tax=candidate division CPR3 bacterium 4484_211 TaxID=1968527 RepID=A0A1W9NXA5_UNCC3|nr:MAG: hypothetical protein B5M47_03420 [candidate division CPR3 bacterium 4484_211]